MGEFSFVRQARLLLVGSGSLLLLIVGCTGKGPDEPLEMQDLAVLKGKVTYHDKPLVHGAILFFSDMGMVCVATIEPDGTYQTKIAPREFKVAIVTNIEPREARMWAKEGPPGVPKGDPSKGGVAPPKPPDPAKGPGAKGGPQAPGKDAAKNKDPYSRYPTLATLREKMDAADRATLDAVQDRFGNFSTSGLTISVPRGTKTYDFDLK